VSALTDIFVSGGTYSAGTATFTNSSTFNVSGFEALGNDTVVTGGTPITQPNLILQIILVVHFISIN
jgi:hypothetical protein